MVNFINHSSILVLRIKIVKTKSQKSGSTLSQKKKKVDDQSDTMIIISGLTVLMTDVSIEFNQVMLGNRTVYRLVSKIEKKFGAFVS